jgi:endoglucanase
MDRHPCVRSLLAVSALTLVSACSKGTGQRSNAGYQPPSAGPVPTLEAAPEPDPLPFAETPVGRHGRLSVEGVHLVDESGQPVQLRGVSSMWLNWEPTGLATSFEAMRWMRDNWSITLFRAAMGVSTGERTAASGGYLVNRAGMRAQVETIVRNATELGIYVLIDWHDHFAQDNTELSVEFFSDMAEMNKDNPSVIYEPFNEPHPGAWDSDERFGWADAYKPYHETVVAAIRERDPEGVIVLGTPFWSQNVDEAGADPVEGDNLMYTVHFYSCTHDQSLRDRALRAIEMGVPIMVTEWGATDASGGTDDETVCDEEADRWHAFMDEHRISWAAWKLDNCTDTSCLLSSSAPRHGGWENYLQGHGPYVVDKLLAPPLPPLFSPTDGGAIEAGVVEAGGSAARQGASPGPGTDGAVVTEAGSENASSEPDARVAASKAPRSAAEAGSPVNDASSATPSTKKSRDAAAPAEASASGTDAAPPPKSAE